MFPIFRAFMFLAFLLPLVYGVPFMIFTVYKVFTERNYKLTTRAKIVGFYVGTSLGIVAVALLNSTP